MKGCRPLTDIEIAKTLERFEGPNTLRDKALFILGIKTGLRITELCKLKVKDVMQMGQIADRVHVSKCTVKNKREGRSIILHQDAKVSLKAYIDFISPVSGEVFLFASQKGAASEPMTRQHAWRIINSAFKKAQVAGNTGTHSLRKTFAHKVFEKTGNNLVVTQHALGHKDLSATGHYLGVDDEEVDEAVLSA